MKNADLPAMPIPLTDDLTGIINNAGAFDNYMSVFSGLSKREMFAMAAMQGLLVNMGRNGFDTPIQVAAESRIAADALLAELERAK